MLYKKRVVSEDVPVETPVVTPVAQPVIEHTTTVERDDSMGGGTAIAVILAGLLVIALVWYFAWYQPQNTVVTQPANTTVIDHESGTATQPIVNNPAPVVNNPPVIVNPPANNPTPNTTIINPPANNSTVVNPPAGSTTTTTTPNSTSSTTTTTTDNNGG